MIVSSHKLKFKVMNAMVIRSQSGVQSLHITPIENLEHLENHTTEGIVTLFATVLPILNQSGTL